MIWYSYLYYLLPKDLKSVICSYISFGNKKPNNGFLHRCFRCVILGMPNPDTASQEVDVVTYLNLNIGDAVPAMGSRSVVCGSLANPEWYILKVMSGREFESQDRLDAIGTHVCFPKREVQRRDGQGRLSRARVAAVPGYLFVKFWQMPDWSEMRRRRMIIGTVCKDTPFGPVPYRATENDVRMFMGIPTVEEELEAQRREAMKVRPGDEARVMVGDNLSLVVTVRQVSNGRVFWDTDAGIKGDTSEGKCERILSDDHRNTRA